jgi:hypothetical protein
MRAAVTHIAHPLDQGALRLDQLEAMGTAAWHGHGAELGWRLKVSQRVETRREIGERETGYLFLSMETGPRAVSGDGAGFKVNRSCGDAEMRSVSRGECVDVER